MKQRYSINKNNQLLISDSPRKKPSVVDGEFSIDKNNHFIFWLNEPSAWRRKYALAPKIIFEGNWRLDPNYDLELILDETKDQFKGNHLTLKGDIISVDSDALVFEVRSLDKRGQSRVQLLKLTGFWQADKHNRLSFQVKKETFPDILTLEGAWQLNKNQQIIYTYQKSDLRTKTKVFNTLTFSGFWQINSANKLTYILSRSSQSRFDFRIQVESPNLYPKKGVIKYRLGIGLKVPKIITLYGAWKFSRKLGLTFQMDYGQGQVRNIEFESEIFLAKKNRVILTFKDKKGEPLGFSLTLSHNFLKHPDAQAFLRLNKLRRASGIEAGMRLPF